MAHVIIQHCCGDAACVSVCPVDCIHPAPDRTDEGPAPALYIDPSVCIDCGACVEVCPVDAIATDYVARELHPGFAELNAAMFAGRLPAEDRRQAVVPHPSRPANRGDAGPLRVGIVGSGPSGAYAATALLDRDDIDVHVDMFEQRTAPWGLVRFGVAPDHSQTKLVEDEFQDLLARDGFRLHLNTTVGTDIGTDVLARCFHAVIYATGATAPRSSPLPGSTLTGNHFAYDFIRWYNGDPLLGDFDIDLSGGTCVVIGNGNAALDVARILLSDADSLAATDISPQALAALRSSTVDQVVVVGRRGPHAAAFTVAELMGLRSSSFDVDVMGMDTGDLVAANSLGVETRAKLALLAELAERGPSANRRLSFLFGATPVAVHGEDHVVGIEITQGSRETSHVIPCDLVLHATGTAGEPIPGIPFDEAVRTIPNVHGRVVGSDGHAETGVYTTGWVKRGPDGVIGTNKVCARETVSAVIEDFRSGLLGVRRPELLDQTIAELPDHIDQDQWRAIDVFERAQGALTGRPRVKVTSSADALRIARAVASRSAVDRCTTAGAPHGR